MTSLLSAIDPRYSVTGSNYPLTAKQKDLVALVDSVGPNFAQRAARYDREASFPFENYDDLRQAGLLGLCVPESFGGKGADLRSYAIVSATLGKYCGATALTSITMTFRPFWKNPGYAVSIKFRPCSAIRSSARC